MSCYGSSRTEAAPMKYRPLREFLSRQTVAEAPMSFAEVEDVLGFPLPASARNHAAWWSNNVGTHVHAAAWRGAGWRTSRVNLAAERVTFVREAAAPGIAEESVTFEAATVPFSHLSRSALAMIDDYAEAAGTDRGEAIAAILEASAAERRRQMLEALPVARMPAGHDSTAMIREDRDAR
jgi:hypothetical protein